LPERPPIAGHLLLKKITTGIQKRSALPGGAAREGLDNHLVKLALNFAGQHQWQATSLAGAPPRHVSIAMALALLAHPHLTITFGDSDPLGTVPKLPQPFRSPDRPILLDADVVCDALSLNRWEFDQLREEIDQRVGVHLKQWRALRWLWARYKLHEEGEEGLFQILFPGIGQQHGSGLLVGCAAQLYALLSNEAALQPDSLYIPTAVQLDDDFYDPRRTFRARFVDESLRRELARGIGADDDEVLSLLDHMITVLPLKHAASHLSFDQWRIASHDSLTGLTGGYASIQWLFEPLKPPSIEGITEWLPVRNGVVDCTKANKCLDSLLFPRASVLLKQIQGRMLAGLINEPTAPGAPFTIHDLKTLHFPQLLEAIIDPVLTWSADQASIPGFATQLRVPHGEASRVLNHLNRSWKEHIRTLWCHKPTSGASQSVQTRLMAHAIRTQTSIRRIWHTPAITDPPHRDLLLLFCGHYFSESPIERNWAEAGDAYGADPIGRWFWATWQRLLDRSHYEQDAITFE